MTPLVCTIFLLLRSKKEIVELAKLKNSRVLSTSMLTPLAVHLLAYPLRGYTRNAWGYAQITPTYGEVKLKNSYGHRLGWSTSNNIFITFFSRFSSSLTQSRTTPWRDGMGSTNWSSPFAPSMRMINRVHNYSTHFRSLT